MVKGKFLASPLAQQLELFQQFQEFKQLLGACAAATLPDSSVTSQAPTGQAKTETATSDALQEEELSATVQLTNAAKPMTMPTVPAPPATSSTPVGNKPLETASPATSMSTATESDVGVVVNEELDYEDDVVEDVMADVLPGKTPSFEETPETTNEHKDDDIRQLLTGLKKSTDRNTEAIERQGQKVVHLATTMVELIKLMKQEKPKKTDKKTQMEEESRKRPADEERRHDNRSYNEESKKRPAEDERPHSDRRYDGDRQRDDYRRYNNNNNHEEKRGRDDRHDNRWRR